MTGNEHLVIGTEPGKDGQTIITKLFTEEGQFQIQDLINNGFSPVVQAVANRIKATEFDPDHPFISKLPTVCMSRFHRMHESLDLNTAAGIIELVGQTNMMLESLQRLSEHISAATTQYRKYALLLERHTGKMYDLAKQEIPGNRGSATLKKEIAEIRGDWKPVTGYKPSLKKAVRAIREEVAAILSDGDEPLSERDYELIAFGKVLSAHYQD